MNDETDWMWCAAAEIDRLKTQIEELEEKLKSYEHEEMRRAEGD